MEYIKSAPLIENTTVPELTFQEKPQKSANVELHLPIEEQSSLLKYSNLIEFQNKKKYMIDKINEESRSLLDVIVGKTIKQKQHHIRSVIHDLNLKYPCVFIMWANESMFCENLVYSDKSNTMGVSNTIKLVYFRKKQQNETM